ncbi:MAG: Auxin-binding protein [Massilia sp.]|nr:Auxin-binding protein [Massilia sp.]
MSKRTLSIISIALLGFVTGCSMLAAPPSDLDVRLSRPSEHLTYVVTMRPIEEPVAIDRLHAWEISLTSAAGVPVTHARIGFDGGMPQHGHGFPTSPRVTGELGDGRYRLDGMKFSMSGWWEMKLTIDSAIGPDKATFNTVIGTPVARVAPVTAVAPVAPVAVAVASVR